MTRIARSGIWPPWPGVALAVFLLAEWPCPVTAEGPKERAALGGHTKVVSRLAVTADSKLLATASYDQTVKLWNLATGKETAAFAGRGDVAFTPDGKTLATGGYEGPLTLRALTTRKEIAAITFDYHVLRLAFTPDSKTLITAGEGPIKLFDAATGKARTTLKLVMTKNNANLVLDLAVTADGKTLATGHADGTINLWDLGTGESQAFPPGGGKLGRREVASVAFSSDGKTLACGFGDGTVKLWDVTTGKERVSVKAHTVRAWSVAFSPDDKALASGGWDGKVKLLDVKTGQELAGFAAHDDRVYALAFTKDGKSLISGGGLQFERGEAKIWDVAAIAKSAGGK
jgi:WD40 repeat protein